MEKKKLDKKKIFALAKLLEKYTGKKVVLKESENATFVTALEQVAKQLELVKNQYTSAKKDEAFHSVYKLGVLVQNAAVILRKEDLMTEKQTSRKKALKENENYYNSNSPELIAKKLGYNSFTDMWRSSSKVRRSVIDCVQNEPQYAKKLGLDYEETNNVSEPLEEDITMTSDEIINDPQDVKKLADKNIDIKVKDPNQSSYMEAKKQVVKRLSTLPNAVSLKPEGRK